MNLTSSFVIDLQKYRKLKKPRVLVRPRVCAALAQAEEFQRQLDAGIVKHRADLAHYHGLSRPRVTQLLDLLKLHPDILDFVRSLGPGRLLGPVTERQLRMLAPLSSEDQLHQARTQIPGFATFTVRGRAGEAS